MRPFAWIAPEETSKAAALPLTLLVRPWPVVALVVLAANDHVLKGAGLLPTWLTGKLSDFAGLLFFPLLLVTLLNLAFDGVGGVLRRPLRQASASSLQLVVACLFTGAFFSAVQIHEPVAELYARATAALAFWSTSTTAEVTMDPTDIAAVPMVVVAFVLGQRSIARVPPGRLPWLRRALAELPTEEERERYATAALRDVWLAQRESLRPLVDALAGALAQEAPDAEIDALLRRVRGEVPFGDA
jgi:hypothetical protein